MKFEIPCVLDFVYFAFLMLGPSDLKIETIKNFNVVTFKVKYLYLITQMGSTVRVFLLFRS